MMSPSSSDTGGGDGRPPPNPILSAYLTFVNTTPLVTRYVMTTIVLSYLVSFVTDPSFALSNKATFTIYQLELYRLVLSPLLCNSLLNLVFAYISFMDSGKRLEYSMGSTAFALLLLTIGTITNIIFTILMISMYYGTGGNDVYLHLKCEGIWLILLAIIAVECSGAPPGSKRRFIAFEVPTIYYPLVILLVFTLLGGMQFPYFISVGVGYAYGKGKLDRLKVSPAKISTWESNSNNGSSGCLTNFAQRQGWVVGHAATGSGAWTNEGGGGNASTDGGGWSPTSFFQGQRTGADSGAAASGGGTVARSPPGGGGGGPGFAAPGEVKKPSFPKSGGQTLGSGSGRGGGGRGGGGGGGSGPRSRPPSDARSAALAAAERRTGAGAGADSNV